MPIVLWSHSMRSAVRVELSASGENLACSAMPYSPFGKVSGPLVYVGSAQGLSDLNVAGAVVQHEDELEGRPLVPGQVACQDGVVPQRAVDAGRRYRARGAGTAGDMGAVTAQVRQGIQCSRGAWHPEAVEISSSRAGID